MGHRRGERGGAWVRAPGTRRTHKAQMRSGRTKRQTDTTSRAIVIDVHGAWLLLDKQEETL